MVMQHSEFARRMANRMGGRSQPSTTGTAPGVVDYRGAPMMGSGFLSVSPADVMGMAVPGIGTMARGLAAAFGPFGVVGGSHAPAVGSREFAMMVAAGRRARDMSRISGRLGSKKGRGGGNVGGGRGQSGQKGGPAGNVGGGGDGGPSGGGPSGGQSENK